MGLRQRTLYHQIHPLKLAADAGASLVSLPLFWRHCLRAALLTHFLPPVVASALLLWRADLQAQRNSPLGRSLALHMTPAMQALRFSGDLLMVAGAWRRRPSVILAGGALILWGWLGSAVSRPRRRTTGTSDPYTPRPA